MADNPSIVNTNWILSALSPKDYERLVPEIDSVTLKLGQILYMPDDLIDYVYFPTTSVVSLLAAMENGATVEAGVTGSEGMVGMPVVLGSDITPYQAMVQGSGHALRMKPATLRQEFNRSGKLHDRLLRYMHTLFTQVAQTAACNRTHRVDERLARWFLLTHDRLKQNEFKLTQEFIARMLGSRRAGVSVAANTLRQAGLIDYQRGSVKILNRKGLEAAACECYEIVRADFDRVLDSSIADVPIADLGMRNAD